MMNLPVDDLFTYVIVSSCLTLPLFLVLPANYGLKKINADVCRWMKGEKNPDGTALAPPFLAMG
jgi:hypothetical protein